MARPQVADGGTASRYGGQLRIYSINNRGQPKRGGPPAWGVGDMLETPHRKKPPRYEMFTVASGLVGKRTRDLDHAQDRDSYIKCGEFHVGFSRRTLLHGVVLV